jgi:hypothetical protein
MVISLEAARVNNAILLEYLAPELALEEPEIGSTDPNIPIDKIARMKNIISGCQGAAGIMKMKVMKVTIAMPSPQPAGDDGPRRNSRGLTWEPVMSTGMRARIATMWMQMRMRMTNHHKSTMDQRRMCRTELGPSYVDGYGGEDGNDADAYEEDEASQADDGSTQNVED